MNSFGVQLSYASVDRGDNSDPRERTRELLVEHRVLGAIRDATAEWGDSDDAVVLIPVTDDGRVLTLTATDTIESVLTGTELRAAFDAAGLNLWLSSGADADEPSRDDVEDSTEPGAIDAALEIADESDIGSEPDFDEEFTDDFDPADFEAEPVQVASFSRRPLTSARLLAQANRTQVEHVEVDGWSLQSYRTTETTDEWSSSVAERPSIELNRVAAPGASWVDVTVGGLTAGPVPFWVDAERDTQPVLDLAAITVPETVEVYRRLLTEGDGSRDDLQELAERCELDVDAAHAALTAEALGGVIGEEARLRTFLAAFGLPDVLVEVALTGDTNTVETAVIEPRGWLNALGEMAVDGYVATIPLSRRERPVPRLARWLGQRPLLSMAASVGELVAGAFGASRLRGVGRAVGVLLIIDAVADLVLWIVRLRRAR